ncbi:MAG TPA: GntR family transcriptional regulator [Rugosimonospora sp.]|jgi:DNA-binding GntR family transcriptional regulator
MSVDDAMTSIRPDYPDPLWIQAVNLVKEEIANGSLRPGMRLPPERELCLQLNISRVTLRKALSELVREGMVNSSHGRGWYVSGAPPRKEWPNSLESFTETAGRMGLVASSQVLRAETVAATLDEAEELSIAPGTAMFHLERVRLLSGVPIALDLTRIPLALAPDLPVTDFSSASFYEMVSRAGVEMRRADSTIEARPADAEVAGHLDLAVGKPVLVMRQLVVDDADRPLFASTIQYNGERYRLRTFFARSATPPRARPAPPA